MREIKTLLEESLFEALKSLNLKPKSLKLEHPENEEYGDYATSIALSLSKNPRQLAEILVKKLQKQKKLKSYFEKIEVAGLGFINFKLSNNFFFKVLKEIIKQKDNYGTNQTGRGKTVIIDYSSPNIAKRFSVAHLRSTIIGQAIYNLYRFCGWRTIGDNHLGDWGTQFGKMIVAVRQWAKKNLNQLSLDDLEKLYVKFHQEALTNPQLNTEARLAFKALEEGSLTERKIWQQLVANSLKEFKKIYRLLKIKIDFAIGESFYGKIMPEVIKEAQKKKLVQKSQGALIINFPQNELPPAILLKSDGATTYLTRDLATIKYRLKRWRPKLIIYEVGAEQSLHFKQLFWASELLGWLKRENLIHIPHGLIRLKEGKMSTRMGKTIKLELVLEEAIKKAQKINPNPKIAQAVGIGAVKYNDLKRAPSVGYVFDWKEVLNLEGNSGPYLQYTYARASSVLKKAQISSLDGETKNLNLETFQFNPEESVVLRKIYQFPEVILRASQEFNPSLICNFLYELAQRYNTFYHRHAILQAPTLNQKKFRLILTQATAIVLKNGLKILGIEILEKM